MINYSHTKEVKTRIEKRYRNRKGPRGDRPVFAGHPGGSLIITSGQLPIDMATGAFPATIEEQTRKSLENCKAVLEASGATMENVIKTTVFLSDMNNFAAMNGVYATFFAGGYPARSAVEVARLPKDALVEIECIAVL